MERRAASGLLCGLAHLAPAAAIAGGALPASARAAQNAAAWPGWRGDGSGVGAARNLPTHWDQRTNVVWRIALPGKGNSSPVLQDGRIFLTAWELGGKVRLVLCHDAATGRQLWRREYKVAKPAETYEKNGYASATPIAAAGRVYAFFDDPGLVALDADGKKLWTRPLGPFQNSWSLAASPALCGEVLVVACDHDKGSFLVGVDSKTGREKWRTPRSLGRQYSCPIVIRHEGRRQVVVNGGRTVAYDPDSGNELWRCKGMKQMCVPSAVYAHGLLWIASGRNGPAMAIDPAGTGEVTETHVRMHVARGGPYVPSPLVLPNRLMMLPADNGKVRFVDLDGKVVAQRRLRGHFSASPVLGDGKIYWSSERGDTYVLDAAALQAAQGLEVKVLSVNPLGETVLASPALSAGRIYLRTVSHLYCLAGEAKAVATPGTDKLPTDFDALKKIYDTHHGDREGNKEHPDIRVRLRVVRALGSHKSPAAIGFLKDVAEKDAHWDVSEEAVKVLCTYGRAALKEMIQLLESGNWRVYLKTSPAEALGRLRAKEASPALRKLTKDGRPLNRIAALTALARIAEGHADPLASVTETLLAGLKDPEGIVQRAAIEGLSLLAGKLGAQRAAALAKVKALTGSKSPIVAKAARKAVERLSKGD